MGVLLYHDQHTDAKVAISEGKVAGDPTPARRYSQRGHFLLVDGLAHVLEHDVAELQRLGYRIASATEQNIFFGGQRQASAIRETPPPPPKIKETKETKAGMKDTTPTGGKNK